MWQNITLGELFPGMKATFENINELSGVAREMVNMQLSMLQTKAGALNEAFSTTTSLLNQLEAAGFYVNMLAPQAKGWLTRLQESSEEESAPLNEGCSAGVVIMLSAPDIVGVAAQYGKLIQILTTGSGAGE